MLQFDVKYIVILIKSFTVNNSSLNLKFAYFIYFPIRKHMKNLFTCSILYFFSDKSLLLCIKPIGICWLNIFMILTTYTLTTSVSCNEEQQKITHLFYTPLLLQTCQINIYNHILFKLLLFFRITKRHNNIMLGTLFLVHKNKIR